jgi:hypothetical protein
MRATQLVLQTEEDAIIIPKMSAQTIGTALAPILSPNGASSYEPLTSVWEGSDGDLLEAMLKFYPTISPLAQSWMPPIMPGHAVEMNQ